MSVNANLVLGTAQLGMPYGIANKSGQPDQAGVEEIVRTAWENGVKKFDTAQTYGDSEQILGDAFRSLRISDQIRVITKLHPDLDYSDRDSLVRSVNGSLEALRISRLYGLMLHREDLLDLWDDGLGDYLRGLVDAELVKRLGISVYTPGKALRALQTKGISFIQVPASIVDHRFDQAGVFVAAKEEGKEVFVRSVFLQGLLLMKPDELDSRMTFAMPVINQLERIVNKSGLGVQEMALGYVRRRLPDAKVVFGAETAGQVRENVSCWNCPLPDFVMEWIREAFLDTDERVLNPSLWPSKRMQA